MELTGIVDFMTRGETAWLDAPRMFGTLGTRDYPERAKGLRLAAAGDGAELAAWLKTSIGAYAMPVALVGASRVREGKGALLDWLRRMHSDECYTMRYCSLEEVAADAENRAILAESFGDHELSSGYARTAAVFHETTNRRDLAVPLALLRSL